MPRSYIPFSTGVSPPRSSALDAVSEKPIPRRSSLSKANQKLQSFFATSKNPKSTDAAALQAANAAQLAYTNSSAVIQPASLSLPTISLSTATGEKSKVTTTTTTLFSPPSPVEVRRLAKQHAQFGPIGSPSHRYSSRWTGEEFPEPIEDEPPQWILITTYFSYLLLILVGHIRDFFARRTRGTATGDIVPPGYAPLNSDFDNFYIRRLKRRLNDVFSRPVTGVPGRNITLLDRTFDSKKFSYTFTGTSTETLNMSSYNYLGFAQSSGPCADAVEACIKKNGVSVASTRADSGTTDLHLEMEELTARFVGKEAAMIFSMGFGTNATAFPALVGKGCLILSDEFNHASIRNGMRLSGAMVQAFKHNNMKDLERMLREAISQGQPRTHRPWKKILVTVEGLYSMEGTICNLPALVALRDRYKFFLYMDEAHSIGGMGPNGRGICDYFGISPSKVDILMGTFTKSFGANGGYIAADKAIIDKLRICNAGVTFGEAPAPAVLMQMAVALRIINGEIAPGQGDERLQRLAFNSRYLRLGLKRLGFIVYGHDDSPIIPILCYHPAKLSGFSHEMLKRKISVVVVGYPATPLISARARLCVSAAHTKEDLDRVLEACDEIGDVMILKLSTGVAGGHEPIPDGLMNEEEKEIAKGNLRVRSPPRWKIKDVLARGVEDVKAPLT